MPATILVILIPLIPLLVFVKISLLGQGYFARFCGIGGTLAMAVVAFLSLFVAWRYFSGAGWQTDHFVPLTLVKYNWLRFTDQLSIDMGIVLDPISVMMLVVISVVSLMVHIFSLGYMKGEKRYATYYGFLSLFTFSMLGLVLCTNLFQMYIFWELVGLSSYLLIGFYFERPSAVAAAKKAFIVTRFADFAFLIGILMLGFHANTLDIGELIKRLTEPGSKSLMNISAASFFGISAFGWALALVFIGGAGKSAMFPLHVWLPDAMEGPTPVSALIHAATMVVAGVYLVARLFPLYSLHENVEHLIVWVGMLSALLAAVIACTQTDIKRVLAYSTMSQIGYMMFSMGLARYGGELGLGFMASMFHLFTHAFFKSLLFLCAGAIIHLVHSNEMGDMGGLRKHMPLTHICFLVACLAIAGIPPFAGFFSKEEILTAAYHSNRFVYVIALIISGLTAFYMFRLYFSIFWRKPAVDRHHNEGNWAMKGPLLILAICSLVAGWLPFSRYVSSDGYPLETHIDWTFSALPVLLALTGIGLAARLYKTDSERPARVAAGFGAIYRVARRKFYIDEVYVFVTKKIIFNGIGRPAAWIDRNIVDGTMNGLALGTARVSAWIKGMQSGRLQSYALYFFGGIALLTVLVIYYWQ